MSADDKSPSKVPPNAYGTEPIRHTVAGILSVTIPVEDYDRLRAGSAQDLTQENAEQVYRNGFAAGAATHDKSAVCTMCEVEPPTHCASCVRETHHASDVWRRLDKIAAKVLDLAKDCETTPCAGPESYSAMVDDFKARFAKAIEPMTTDKTRKDEPTGVHAAGDPHRPGDGVDGESGASVACRAPSVDPGRGTSEAQPCEVCAGTCYCRRATGDGPQEDADSWVQSFIATMNSPVVSDMNVLKGAGIRAWLAHAYREGQKLVSEAARPMCKMCEVDAASHCLRCVAEAEVHARRLGQLDTIEARVTAISERATAQGPPDACRPDNMCWRAEELVAEIFDVQEGAADGKTCGAAMVEVRRLLGEERKRRERDKTSGGNGERAASSNTLASSPTTPAGVPGEAGTISGERHYPGGPDLFPDTPESLVRGRGGSLTRETLTEIAARAAVTEEMPQKAAPGPNAGVTDPNTRDVRCPDCGQMMTNHVVVTRHEISACAEQFTGPPLRAGLSSGVSDAKLRAACDKWAAQFAEAHPFGKYLKLRECTLYEAVTGIKYNPLAPLDRAGQRRPVEEAPKAGSDT